MAWEKRGSQQFYYRSRRVNGFVQKIYLGAGQRAQQASEQDRQQQESRERERVFWKKIEALDLQTDALTHMTRTIANAFLLINGYHQHKRIWRRKRQINQDITYGGTLMTPERKLETLPLEELEELVCSARQGNLETLPAIRDLLNQSPGFQNIFSLATRVKGAWLDAITGQDIISREVLEREANAHRVSLTLDPSNALEGLLIENIVINWLALQNALRRAGEQVNQYGTGLTTTHENHLTACQKRFLMAVKELARIRQLLKPRTTTVVNIADKQQVNLG